MRNEKKFYNEYRKIQILYVVCNKNQIKIDIAKRHVLSEYLPYS